MSNCHRHNLSSMSPSQYQRIVKDLMILITMFILRNRCCFFEIRNVVSFSSGNFDSLVLQIGELHNYSKLSNTKGFKYFRKWEAIDCKYVQIRLNELKSY